MIASVFIEPHERYEAVETYKDRLRQDQIEQIEEAPDNALISIQFGIGVAGAVVTVIQEG